MQRKAGHISATIVGALFLVGCSTTAGSRNHVAGTGAISGYSYGCDEVFYFPSNARNDAMGNARFGSTESGVFTQELDDAPRPAKDSKQLVNVGKPDDLQTVNCTRYSNFAVRHLEPGTYYLTSTTVTSQRDDRGTNWHVPTPRPRATFIVSSAMQRVVVKPDIKESVTLRPDLGNVLR